MVVNHGVPEKLREDMLKASQSFFDMPEEEKREYMVQDVLAPIKCGTSFEGPAAKAFVGGIILGRMSIPKSMLPTNLLVSGFFFNPIDLD